MTLLELALVASFAVLPVSVGLAEDPVPLPDICGSAMSMPMGDVAMMGAPTDEGHKALMAGMDTMNAQMMQGSQAADLDVAFICAMIPHHQGAINMAKAELQYGDDPWARELAQNIVEAQEKEIEAMRDWLVKQPR